MMMYQGYDATVDFMKKYKEIRKDAEKYAGREYKMNIVVTRRWDCLELFAAWVNDRLALIYVGAKIEAVYPGDVRKIADMLIDQGMVQVYTFDDILGGLVIHMVTLEDGSTRVAVAVKMGVVE